MSTATELRAEYEVQEAALTILDDLHARFTAAQSAPETLDWVLDLSTLMPAVASFLTDALGKGEVNIKLYGDEVLFTETSVPGLWRLKLGRQESLIAALLPRCVERLLDQGAPAISCPKESAQGLFAGPALLAQIASQLQAYEDAPNEVFPQIDLLRQPLTPADKNYLMTALGTGDIVVELEGFASSRILSTKVRHLWRNEIFNDAGKPLLLNVMTTRLPSEIPAAPEDLVDSVDKIEQMQEWIRADRDRIAARLSH